MIPSSDRTADLRILHAAIVAALGAAAAPACSGSNGTSGRTEVDLPPQPSASQTVATESPDRPSRQVGYVKEPNGSIHRASPVSCDTRIDIPACRGDEGHKTCSADAECKDGPNGRCISGSGQIGTYCGCEYACEIDSDCKSGEACVCATEANEKHSVCAAAACKADADCGAHVCGVSRHFNGCGNEVRLACRTSTDTCASDTDCTKHGTPGGQCAAGRGGDSAWSCQQMTCMIGRPFTVEGSARVASVGAGSAWTDGDLATRLAPGAASLPSALRAASAARSLEQARLEHASVASFARASLELIALGAPPDLLRDTARAMQDEVAHARVCFAIAHAYGAEDAEPGPLDLAGAMLGAIDPARVAYAVAYEGCVGETLGAAEGGEDARSAKDPVLGEVLARIADDETRHAALAWRTLAWIVATYGDEARDAARRGIADGLRGFASGGGALRAETARLVVAPMASHVLGESEVPS